MSKPMNDASHWREFEKNDITHSAAHYLMAIDALRQEYGYARVTDVAEMLEISRGAASMALSQLKKRGWVTEDRKRFLLLTDEGARMARLVEQNFNILSKFFQDVLGVEKDLALSDACKMEHLMSLETGRRMVWLMKFVLSDASRTAGLQEEMERFQELCETHELCPVCALEGDCMYGSCPKEECAADAAETN